MKSKGGGPAHTSKNTSRTRFSLLPSPIQMADIGCGIGGSSRHVARAFPGATAHGITLSPVQAARANALAADAGLAAVARFSVGDALRPCPPLEAGGYDLVWSLESGEHMPDKRAFVRALASLAAPGGKVVIATWVHRDLEGERRGEGGGKERREGSKRGVQRKTQNALSFLSLSAGETALPPADAALLAAINAAYYLPPWCSGADYVELMTEAGLQNIKRDDWSADVAPFWGKVIQSALTLRGVTGLLRSGFKTVRGAAALPLMAMGFRRGVIKFVLLVGDKV